MKLLSKKKLSHLCFKFWKTSFRLIANWLLLEYQVCGLLVLTKEHIILTATKKVQSKLIRHDSHECFCAMREQEKKALPFFARVGWFS